MNRKEFISKVLPAVAGGLLVEGALANSEPKAFHNLKLAPPYLLPGDTIGICCPAGSMGLGNVENCVARLKKWGLKVKLGNTVGDRWQRFGGTDEERASDFQALLDNSTIKAILFGRGGYGVMRIMDNINWNSLKEHPKWLVGFSDITALHCHINSLFGIPTMHAGMAISFKSLEDYSSYSLKRVLMGELIDYQFDGNNHNRIGSINGELVGGNLSMIYAMQASPGALKTRGKILMLEDVNEYKYMVDRMLLNLKRSGMLDHLAALVIGGFTNFREETDPEFTMPLEEMILEKVKEFNYPVAFGFPAGHQRPNLAFKLGMLYELNVGTKECSITEIPGITLPPIPPDGNKDSSYPAMQDMPKNL